MRFLALLGFRPDDASDNPQHWSQAKLLSERERIQKWLDSESLSERERAALERVFLRITKVAAKKKSRRQPKRRFDSSSMTLL